MKAWEFIKKGIRKQPELPYHAGWDALTRLKERAAHQGAKLGEEYQLFVPRGVSNVTRRQRRLHNLKNPWSWDDQGTLKQNYSDWEDQGALNESPPVLVPGHVASPPGNNKPGAMLWTSTAQQIGQQWTSDWNQWVIRNQPNWSSELGYLYQVKPGTTALPIDSDYDAEGIYHAMIELGLAQAPTAEDYAKLGRDYALVRYFPWDAVSKNFDAVHHYGYRDKTDRFVYGWDCESTAWFNTSRLQFVGTVAVVTGSDRNEDED